MFRSSEVTDLSQISVLVVKCYARWNSEKWISLSVSHYSSPTVTIAETMYKIHVGMSLICKLVRHFDHLTELQRSQTVASQDRAKSVTPLHYSSINSSAWSDGHCPHTVNITCRGVTATARMLHALTHSSISRQVREQM